MGRSSSRKHAFYIIYQLPFHKEKFDLRETAEEYIAEKEIEKSDAEFMLKLVGGVTENLSKIDAQIGERAGWGFDRIATVDLAILRLAIFETRFSDDAPISVAINEAVELAKEFGTDDSAAFVNGLLAQVVKQVEADE